MLGAAAAAAAAVKPNVLLVPPRKKKKKRVQMQDQGADGAAGDVSVGAKHGLMAPHGADNVGVATAAVL